MTRAAWLCLAASLLTLPTSVCANLLPRPFKLDRVNRRIAGRVVDHTHNHGHDNRIYSRALGEKRDMYVYLPPGYDPAKKYPFILLLHGFLSDEVTILDYAIKPIDDAIRCGKLPPCIVAAPDGTVSGIGCLSTIGTFFVNSKLGCFEDYLIGDIVPFVLANYSIHPDPKARAIVGLSMGGCPAFSQTIKHPELFRNAAGMFPPLNLRWISCRGKHRDKFDPNCWGWREDFSRGFEVIGRFYAVITFRQRRVVYPLYGRDNATIVARVSAENPIELLDTYNVKPGQFGFYVAYAGKDEFHLDGEAESFLYRAKQKGLEVTSVYDPRGRHNVPTAMKLLPDMIKWMHGRLSPYAPK